MVAAESQPSTTRVRLTGSSTLLIVPNKGNYGVQASSKLAPRERPTDTARIGSLTQTKGSKRTTGPWDLSTTTMTTSTTPCTATMNLVETASSSRGIRLLFKAKEFHLAARNLQETTGFRYMVAQPPRYTRQTNHEATTKVAERTVQYSRSETNPGVIWI